MQIRWLGHASFLIISKGKSKIIVDPYTVGGGINYKPIDESADIVTMSHDHGDHNNAKSVKGDPTILKQAGSYHLKDIEIKTIPVFHDEVLGSKRGKNLIFCFKVDGLNLCHLGDLGHRLNQQQVSVAGEVDVLFVPVGGYYTIDAKEATEVIQAIKPKVVFPMHYKTPKTDYPIAGIDQFLKDKKYVRRLNSSGVEINKDNLPEETEIVILQSAY
jgi:L-ascorbate metabolism protein UlaG (beta-lactamase superfamily)